MEEITNLVATLVLPAILTAVPICCLVNVAKDRQQPLRSAVDTAQTLVTRWAGVVCVDSGGGVRTARID